MSRPSAIVANRVQHGPFDDRQRAVFERLRMVDTVEPMLVEAAGRAVRTVIEAARITERRAEVGAGHLERLRNGLPPDLATIVVPELYTRASGRRVVTLVAEALADQIGDSRHRSDGRSGEWSVMPARDGASGLDAMLAAKEMVLVCGSGGVGKTTTAAALAATAATHLGGRVLVLTVDPARRLADALGIGALGEHGDAGAR